MARLQNSKKAKSSKGKAAVKKRTLARSKTSSRKKGTPGKASSLQQSEQADHAVPLHPLQKLPKEFQLEVWRAAAPPCIFRLGWGRDSQAPVHQQSLRSIPPLLHTCQDSRNIILDGMVGDTYPSSSGLFTIEDAQGSRDPERFFSSAKFDTLWIPSGALPYP